MSLIPSESASFPDLLGRGLGASKKSKWREPAYTDIDPPLQGKEDIPEELDSAPVAVETVEESIPLSSAPVEVDPPETAARRRRDFSLSGGNMRVVPRRPVAKPANRAVQSPAPAPKPAPAAPPQVRVPAPVSMPPPAAAAAAPQPVPQPKPQPVAVPRMPLPPQQGAASLGAFSSFAFSEDFAAPPPKPKKAAPPPLAAKPPPLITQAPQPAPEPLPPEPMPIAASVPEPISIAAAQPVAPEPSAHAPEQPAAPAGFSMSPAAIIGILFGANAQPVTDPEPVVEQPPLPQPEQEPPNDAWQNPAPLQQADPFFTNGHQQTEAAISWPAEQEPPPMADPFASAPIEADPFAPVPLEPIPFAPPPAASQPVPQVEPRKPAPAPIPRTHEKGAIKSPMKALQVERMRMAESQAKAAVPAPRPPAAKPRSRPMPVVPVRPVAAPPPPPAPELEPMDVYAAEEQPVEYFDEVEPQYEEEEGWGPPEPWPSNRGRRRAKLLRFLAIEGIALLILVLAASLAAFSKGTNEWVSIIARVITVIMAVTMATVPIIYYGLPETLPRQR